MGPDQTVEIMRRLLIEAMLLSAPLLVAAALVSLAVSLLQTLTSVQEQTLTAVPRLVVVFVITVAVLPWMVHRLVGFTVRLFTDFHKYLG
ncbi:flagellar biosynthetic protein FliQ [Tunturiibacter gelidoferens]|jgi:flagellar biosynthetic protein FliQ|uniref:Flagellar biosynthetic protein FliQ n=1 Tax=Tunturiibacter gelidiferens TaxID=3069689 RepID=A0A9X0U5S6_9BACT|nr:flagellar biosynthetic protein FliQ [Edaphobacter lichenicola]MBB5330834.1 flagellar biosynthetic protein FliQ [Edaphobacter lichenicola]